VNTFEAVKGRRSIRKFQEKEIPRDAVDKLIDTLIWAPSAGNLQARKFYFITNQDRKDSLSRAALNQTFIAHAPLVVVGCTDSRVSYRYGERGVVLYSIQDVACSIMGMMLVAHEMGLGTVWVGAFHEGDVAKVLNLPGNLRPVAIVPVGWPSKVPFPPDRVDPDEAIIWD
jgi:nitroreductase